MARSKLSKAVRDQREGDIMVTRVARRFAIGRLNADCSTQTPIEIHADRVDALDRACAMAGTERRIFLCLQMKVNRYHPYVR